MSIKITIPNTSSDTLTFGSANTPTAAQVAGIDSGSSNGQLAIYTTASGTSTERVRVDSAGNVGIGRTPPSSAYRLSIKSTGTTSSSFATYVENSSGTVLQQLRDDGTFENYGEMKVMSAAGLGYGTGSGGTVTQATSKSTAVTLNKPTGQITTNTAALAAGATVSFTVNNSLFTTSDLVLLAVGNGSSYTVIPQFVGSGTFNIRLTNTTAGSLSEAVQINFALIKGASA